MLPLVTHYGIASNETCVGDCVPTDDSDNRETTHNMK